MKNSLPHKKITIDSLTKASRNKTEAWKSLVEQQWKESWFDAWNGSTKLCYLVYVFPWTSHESL